MVISGYDFNNKKTELCCFILIMNEKEFTFYNIFKVLLAKYHFNPKNIMCDFRTSQIKAAKKIFPHANIHCCFFHYSQALWNNMKKYNLSGEGTYAQNAELLFNLQILCFIKKEKVEYLFEKITKKYKQNLFKKFFIYFKRTWLGKTIPIPLWNYSDLIEEEENSISNIKFHYTNNICENINRFLNINLKKAKCSSIFFKESILNVMDQFNNKTNNDISEKSKSELIKFYLKRKNNITLLSNDEIKDLNKKFDEINFSGAIPI